MSTTETKLSAGQRPAALWAILAKIASKEWVRGELPGGLACEYHLSVAGVVGGAPVATSAGGILTVGADQQKASSTGPKAEHVLACVLSKLNETTRDKILAELPEHFAKEGELPDVSALLMERTKQFLARLRNKKQITARGPIGCQYELTVRP